MKNIFIGGVARSGKGTLSEEIKKVCPQYNHISLDYITASLSKNFPETGIKTSVIIGDSSPKLALLLSKTMEIINTKNEKFIIDSAHIMPKDLIRHIDRENWDIYYLGYPRVATDEKVRVILEKDDENDWTKKKSPEELAYRIEKLIEISKKIQKQCSEFNIEFIDTSFDFDETIKKVAEMYK